VTLPRFDLMAQLDKVPDGMTLSDVSKRMMVFERQCDGAGRAPGRIRACRPAHVGFRSARAGDPADESRPGGVSQDGRRNTSCGSPTSFSDLSPKDVRELMRLLAKTKASARKSAQQRAL